MTGRFGDKCRGSERQRPVSPGAGMTWKGLHTGVYGTQPYWPDQSEAPDAIHVLKSKHLKWKGCQQLESVRAPHMHQKVNMYHKVNTWDTPWRRRHTCTKPKTLEVLQQYTSVYKYLNTKTLERNKHKTKSQKLPTSAKCKVQKQKNKCAFDQRGSKRHRPETILWYHDIFAFKLKDFLLSRNSPEICG